LYCIALHCIALLPHKQTNEHKDENLLLLQLMEDETFGPILPTAFGQQGGVVCADLIFESTDYSFVPSASYYCIFVFHKGGWGGTGGGTSELWRILFPTAR